MQKFTLMKFTNRIITFILLGFAFITVKSQLQLQTYVANKETEVLAMYDRDFKSNPKWNYFALGTVAYNYDGKDFGLELYQNLNYQIAKNWGVSVGATISKDDVSPLVGLAYLYEKNAFSFSLFPAVNYSFDAKQMGYGFYSLVEYTPKINEKFNFYSMLVLESDFSFKQHSISNQTLRIGLETQKKFQFGLGTNITEMGEKFDTEADFGVFIGKKF